MVDGGSSLDIFPIYVLKLVFQNLAMFYKSSFTKRIHAKNFHGARCFYETDLKSLILPLCSARFEFGENSETLTNVQPRRAEGWRKKTNIIKIKGYGSSQNPG